MTPIQTDTVTDCDLAPSSRRDHESEERSEVSPTRDDEGSDAETQGERLAPVGAGSTPTSRTARGRGRHDSPELLDYLSVAKRRWYVLVGVPVAAALFAIGYVVFAPTVWTATATVSAPALVGGEFGTQYAGSQAVNQYVAQFQAVASGPAVRAAVAEQTGVEPSAILRGLTVSQVGASTVMTITYQDRAAENVEPVIAGVANTTLDMLFGQQVVLAESLVKSSTEALMKASSAIEKWEADNGLVSPGDVYREKLSQVSNLEQQAVSFQANGNAAGAAAAKATAAAVQGELKSFGPLLAEYNGLVSTRDATVASQAQAQQSLQDAQAQQMAADPAQVVRIGRVHASAKADALLTTLLPVTGAGIFLGVVLVVALEMLAASRRRSGEEAATSGAADDGNGTPGDEAVPLPQGRPAVADVDAPECLVVTAHDET